MASAADFLNAPSAPSASDYLSQSDVPTYPTQEIEPSSEIGGGLDFQRTKAGLPPERPFPEPPAPQLAPYITGSAKAFLGIVPQSLEDIERMAKLPMPSLEAEQQQQESEELGKAWRGEYGPEAQAQSIVGSLLQAAPLAHLPFAESPVVPAADLAETIRNAQYERAQAEANTAAQAAQAIRRAREVTEPPPPEPPPPQPWVSPETGFVFPPMVAPEPDVTAANVTAGQQPLPFQAVSEAIKALQPPPPNAAPGIGIPPQPMVPQGAAGAEIPPEDLPYAGGEVPQAPQTPVGANVAGFEQTYGPGEIPAGGTITPGDAWDAAAERARTGKAQPYGFVDRARTGAITHEELADLIYEHQQLVNAAGAAEGTPQYNELRQRAKTFAQNVVKPAENAWHLKGQVMQIAVQPDFTSMTGIENAAERMGREIQKNEISEARRVAAENKSAAQAVQQSGQRMLDAMDREYSRGARRVPKTAEQLRAQLADKDPCVFQ